MQLRYNTYSLQFKHPFGVYANTRSTTTSIMISISHEGCCGYGEACLPQYLGETAESTIDFLKQFAPHLNTGSTEKDFEELIKKADTMSLGNNAAKAAIDIALNDLLSKIAGKSFRDWKNITPANGLPTSFTIGIDSEKMVIQKIQEAEAFGILKIKAGTSDDKALITLIRKHTHKPLYVDVNQGWRDKEFALDMIEWMHLRNVVLIEQPLPKTQNHDMVWLTERSPILTIADESVKRLSDLEGLDGAFAGINIKLMKSTGLTEAIKMIDFCKKNQLKILLGCMAESSCATTAMAQLMGFADYLDLDAPQLYTNDPFKGLRYNNGNIYLNNLTGIGVEPLQDLFTQNTVY